MEISAFGEEAPSADGRLHSPLTTLVQSYVALREAEAREAEAASRAAALSFALESAPGPPSDLLTDAQRAQAVTVVEGYYADASRGGVAAIETQLSTHLSLPSCCRTYLCLSIHLMSGSAEPSR